MQKFNLIVIYLALTVGTWACEGENDDLGVCLEESFTTTRTQPGVFTFDADTRRDNVLYYWYINDILAGDAGNHSFTYDFLLNTQGNVPGGPGEYRICLSLVTPGCEQGTALFCETITVEAPTSSCPDADFSAEETRPGKFEFTAEFKEEGVFYWYIDDVLSGDAGSHIFAYDFLLEGVQSVPHGPGEYNICLEIATADCPQASEQFCETITVSPPTDPCIQVTFTTNETGPRLYRFASQSNDPNPNTLYYWYLDGNLSGDAAKDYFEYDFNQDPGNTETGAGEYEVCLQTLTPECPNGSGFYCEKIEIQAGSDCPDPAFVTENTQGGVYKFTSPFQGQGIYYWYIDGLLAGDAGSNVFQYDFLLSNGRGVPGGPGSYDVCLRIITPACQQGSELYCTTIVVK